jgi:hypothetical protein
MALFLPPSDSNPIVCEEAPTGPQSTAWLWPKLVPGPSLYFGTDSAGFHFGSAVKFWSEADREAFQRRLFEVLARSNPRVRVPR